MRTYPDPLFASNATGRSFSRFGTLSQIIACRRGCLGRRQLRAQAQDGRARGSAVLRRQHPRSARSAGCCARPRSDRDRTRPEAGAVARQQPPRRLWKRHAATRIFPCSLRGPPDDPASGQDENAEGDPAVEADRDDSGSKHEYRRDHRDVIRSCVTAVRAPATPAVQNACRTHPDERDDPHRSANRYGSE
jgi:hypothetical protein